MRLSPITYIDYIFKKKFSMLNYILTLLFFCYCTTLNAQTWNQSADFPSTERDDGVVFVIGNNAYCGTGLKTGWLESNDFYSFDMNSDSWSTIETLPKDKKRQYAVGFSSLNYGYVFGGVNDGNFLNDIWQYDPVTNKWTEKSKLPSIGRNGVACFVIKNIAYIIGGKTVSNVTNNELWAYDMTNDTWSKKNNLPFGACWRSSATTVKDKGYLIFGIDQNNKFYSELFEYNPTIDSWKKISDFPGIGRSYSSLNSINNELFLMGGVDTFGTYYNDMWHFNLISLKWKQLNSLPSTGRKGGVCFNNSTTIYYSTGIDQGNNRLKETWKCDNPNEIKEVFESEKLLIYPNPINEIVILEIPNFVSNQGSKFSLFDNFGKNILTKSITEKITEINLSKLSKGFYFIRVEIKESIRTIKLIKQ